MFASQTLSEFLVYLVCALIWNMSTVDVSAAHPMLIYIAYFICGMGSLYGVYRFMLQFASAGEASAPFALSRRRVFFSCFSLLLLDPGRSSSAKARFTTTSHGSCSSLPLLSTIAAAFRYTACTAMSPPCAPASAWSCSSGNARLLLEQCHHLDARKEEEIRELHHEIRNCILTPGRSLKHGSTRDSKEEEKNHRIDLDTRDRGGQRHPGRVLSGNHPQRTLAS